MEFRTPWDPVPVVTPLPEASPSPPKPRGRRPAMQAAAVPPWLYHHLTISGPAEEVASFGDAARGAGIVPWRVESARLEEDIFHLAASQPRPVRSLTVEGCRILARHFRERAEARAGRPPLWSGAAAPVRSISTPSYRYRPPFWSWARPGRHCYDQRWGPAGTIPTKVFSLGNNI